LKRVLHRCLFFSVRRSLLWVHSCTAF
jgi:hypothetical protein